MNDEQSQQAAADLFTRALTDADFKARLMADAASVMRAEGVDVPEGVEVKIVENSSSTVYVVLPDPQTVSDELLATASGGACFSCLVPMDMTEFQAWYQSAKGGS